MIKVGFIGTGNMGGALATAASRGENVELFLANHTIKVADALSKRIGGRVVSNVFIARECEYIFLCVKPQNIKELADEINNALNRRNDKFVIVSIVAGKSVEQLRELLNVQCPIIRLEPNIPCIVQEGMLLYTYNQYVSEEQLNQFLTFMSSAGRFSLLSEDLIAAGAGVAGCGPAFAAMFIDALADGGVASGLSRVNAIEYAAQMVKGTAQYILEKGIHPDVLKDAVCSPGGTTVQGVRTLEKYGFRGSAIEAVISTVEKDNLL